MDFQKKLKKKYSEAYLQEIFNERVTKILILETYRGSIFIELIDRDVPLVKDVIAKALLGEYDGMMFYNCNSYFIQMRKGIEEKETVEKIIRPYLKNERGTVGLINSKKNPSKALLDHLYVSLSEIPEIDGEYTIIGRVVKGLDVLNKIWDGNTVRRAYIEKGSVAKTPTIKKLSAIYWVGLAMIIVYALWLLSSNLEFLKEFQTETFGKVVFDTISKTNALIILGIGILLIIISLILSSIQIKMKLEETPTTKEKKEREEQIMEKITTKRVELTRELEGYKEKELVEKEKQLTSELKKEKPLPTQTISILAKPDEKETQKLKKELEDLKKQIEGEKKRLEDEKRRKEIEADVIKKQAGEERQRREKEMEELRKRNEEDKLKKEREMEELRKRAEEERKRAEELKKHGDEKEKLRMEIELRRMQEKQKQEEANLRKQHDEEERLRKIEEEKLKKQNEKEEGKRRIEEERLRKKQEEETKRRLAEEEKLRINMEEQKKKEEEKLRREQELESKRKQFEEEKIKRQQELEGLKKRTEEERKVKEKELGELRKRIEEEKRKREELRKTRTMPTPIEQPKPIPSLPAPIKKEILKETKIIPSKPVPQNDERRKMVEIMTKHKDIKKEMKNKNKEEIKKEVLPQIARKTETQLDVLYELLDKNKTLKLSYIMQTFNISKEEAVEWCNILVEHELAELKYPAFGDPILIKK